MIKICRLKNQIKKSFNLVKLINKDKYPINPLFLKWFKKQNLNESKRKVNEIINLINLPRVLKINKFKCLNLSKTIK